MPEHILAQDAALFLLSMIGLIVVVIYRDIRKENNAKN
jgi:hypothetical protein